MLLTQIEYFVTLSRERHFGRAADACHVSQSALSESIHKLEIELDVRLVYRGHAFEGLTPEGEQFLVGARRIVADHAALRDSMDALSSGITGTLRLGVVPSANAAAALLVDRFTAAHPLAHVVIESGLPSEEVTRRIRRFELDMGIMYPIDEETSDLTFALLYHERQRVIMTAGHDAAPSSMRVSDIVGLPLGLLQTSMTARRLLDEALAREGIGLDPHVTADSIESLITLVRTGRWVGIVPSPPDFSTSLPTGILAVDLVEPTIVEPVVLAMLATQPVSTLARAMTQVARDRALWPSTGDVDRRDR